MNILLKIKDIINMSIGPDQSNDENNPNRCKTCGGDGILDVMGTPCSACDGEGVIKTSYEKYLETL